VRKDAPTTGECTSTFVEAFSGETMPSECEFIPDRMD